MSDKKSETKITGISVDPVGEMTLDRPSTEPRGQSLTDSTKIFPDTPKEKEKEERKKSNNMSPSSQR